MLSISLFWLALGVPGFALLRRCMPQALEGGGPSVLALSYLASFTLLSPVSLLGYAFALPIAVLSSAVVVLTLAGVASLAHELRAERVRAERQGPGPHQNPVAWPAISPLVLAVCAMLFADALYGFFRGTHFGGDAGYHIARVRLLLTHGFNGIDPLAAGGTEPVYRANLYHALIASAADLTDTTARQAWFGTWSWAKLVSAAAAGHLAFICSRERWIAWTAAAAAAVWNVAYSVVPFPNTLAFTWLLPLSAAFCVEACTESIDTAPARMRHAVLGLFATSLALGQLHPLYAVFMALTVAPALALRSAYVLYTRRQLRALIAYGVCLAALAPGVLWPIATKLHPLPRLPVSAPVDPEWLRAGGSLDAGAEPQGDDEEVESAPDERVERGFIKLADGSLILSPQAWAAPMRAPGQLLVALLLASFTRLRRRMWPLFAMIGVVMACAHVPFITHALIKAAGPAWIVRRLFGVVAAVHLGVVPAVLLALIPLGLRWLQALGVVLALWLAFVGGERDEPWTHARMAVQIREVLDGTWEPPSAARTALFDEHVPRDATVVVRLKNTYALVSDCNCFPFATREEQGQRGRGDMNTRRAATDVLLGDSAPLESRLALLRHFEVRHMLVPARRLAYFRKLFGRHLIAAHKVRREVLLEIEPDASRAAARARGARTRRSDAR